MDRLLKQLLLGLAIATAFGLAGCRALETPKLKLPFGGDKEDGKPDMKDVLPPQKLVALWSNTVYNAPGKPATRGLAARVYFYDANRKTVPVEGNLTIYGYDDSKSGGGNRKPDRKYVFKPEQLASHFSVSEFGPSYSIWIPWDQVGRPQQDVSLVPVFTGKDGQAVMGEHTQHVLAGPASAVTARPQALGTHNLAASLPDPQQSGHVRLAGYEASRGSLDVSTAGGENVEPTQRLRATSIKLPPMVRQRLIESSGNELQPSASTWQNGQSQVRIHSSAVATMAPEAVAKSAIPTTMGFPTATESQYLMPMVPAVAPAASTVLARIHSKTNSQRRSPVTHFAPATRPAPALPMQQPAPHPPGMPPYPSGWQSAPASQPGHSPGN